MQEFNTLTIFRSSAGSGKTYTLVKEYLKLTLSHPQSFRQVLAITFTNKASDEMKSRIVKTLVDFTEGKSPELKEELKKILNKSEENFNSDVKKLLGLILHYYSDFAVCTIDSFFNKVIRSLSKEMGLPLKFDTELNQDVVIREITGRLLLDAGKDNRLTSWLEDFIFSKMGEDKGWNI
ncbi:MAG: UvrD-helicase domain-containing protein, partial [Bacteroidota bacterium]